MEKDILIKSKNEEKKRKRLSLHYGWKSQGSKKKKGV